MFELCDNQDDEIDKETGNKSVYKIFIEVFRFKCTTS